MAKTSKRMSKMREELKSLEPQTVSAAIGKLKGFANTKFDQSVEVAMNLGIDPRQADQMIRGSVSLPHNIGKPVRVAVFAQGDRAAAAEAAGADIVGAEELAEKIKGGFFDFDVCLASADMMKVVGGLGRTLGPKGLMPSPKSGTLIDLGSDLGQAVTEFKAGKVEYRADSGGNLHAMVGKLSLDEAKLIDNIEAFVGHITAIKPAAVRGHYIKSVTVSATMTPGIKISAA